MNSGFLKLLVLNKLSAADLTGSQLMQAIEKETPFHKPSPGSMYPLLAQLTEDKLIKRIDEGKAKRYSITKKGLNQLNKMIDWRTEAFSAATSIFAGDIASKKELAAIKERFKDSEDCGDVRQKSRGITAWNDFRRALIKFLTVSRLDTPEAEEVFRILEEAQQNVEQVTARLKKE